MAIYHSICKHGGMCVGWSFSTVTVVKSVTAKARSRPCEGHVVTDLSGRRATVDHSCSTPTLHSIVWLWKLEQDYDVTVTASLWLQYSCPGKNITAVEEAT